MFIKILLIYLVLNTHTYARGDLMSKIDCKSRTRRTSCECLDYKVKCGPITLLIFSDLEQIRCTTANASDYNLLPNLSAGSLKKLTFTNCPFPNAATIESALKRLGVTEVDEITFQNGYDITDSHIQPQDQHYEDFPGLTGIAMHRFHYALPENYFAKCKNVRELRLKGYGPIHANIFNSLEQLERVNVFVKNMAEVSSDLFRNLYKLRLVEVNCQMAEKNTNRFVVTPQLLANLTELRVFDLKNCGDTLPPALFKDNGNLERIFIRTDLKTLPKDLFENQYNLITLRLERNKIETIPKELFRNTIKLRVLYLANNNITTLPRYIFDSLRNLQVLNLENNPLTTINPYAFSELRAKIYIQDWVDKARNKEFKFHTQAVLCKEENFYGICRFCERIAIQEQFAGEEECFG